jgi:hypothetical protein
MLTKNYFAVSDGVKELGDLVRVCHWLDDRVGAELSVKSHYGLQVHDQKLIQLRK